MTFLLTICSAILLLDTSIYNESKYYEFEKKSIFRTFLCNFCLFVLSCIADNTDDKDDLKSKDKGLKNDEKKCPSEFSSFLSKITFYWYTEIIKKSASSKGIEPNDIYDLPENYKVEKVTNKFNEIYLKELEFIKRKNLKLSNSSKKILFNWISLLKLIWKSSYLQILLFVSLDLLVIILLFSKTILLDLLITFISNSNQHSNDTLIATLIALIFNLFILLIVFNQYNMISTAFRMNLRTACSNLIYQKALRLGPKGNSTGKIMNLFLMDSDEFSNFTNYIVEILSAPFQFSIGFYLLYCRLGNSSFVGLAFIIFVASLQHFFAEYKKKYYKEEVEIDDQRIKLINEAIFGINVIKLSALEKVFEERISTVRNKQADINKKLYYLEMLFDLLFNSLSPLLVFLSTIAVFIFFIDPKITPQQVFFASSIFGLIMYPIKGIPKFVSQLFKNKISLDRICSFLNEKELENYVTRNYDEVMALTIKDKATFSYQENLEFNQCPNLEFNSLLKNHTIFKLNKIELEVKKGDFLCILGPIGSGKSSLISAILGDMHLHENDELGNKGKVNISKGQNICYVAQQAFVQNDSLKNNILFGRPFYRKIYQDVIKSCALESDLKQLEAGDETIIGEKGINLSGGQKQRINLARACYTSLSTNNKDQIIILDDPLSSVDVHVGRHLCEQVLNSKTGILKGTTRVLITNQLNQLKKLNVDKIVLLKNGEIILNCSLNELLKMEKSGKLKEYNLDLSQYSNAKEFDYPVETDENNDEIKDNNNLKNVKIAKESENSEVGMKNYLVLFKYFGYLNFAFLIFATLLGNFFRFCSKTYLSTWTEYNLNNSNITIVDENKKEHLLTYASLSLIEMSSYALANIFMIIGIINCIRLFHKILLLKVLRSPMEFFMVTTHGDIMTRFTQDIREVDSFLPRSISELAAQFLELFSCLFVLIYKQKSTLVWFVFIFYFYYMIMNLFSKYSRQVKKYETNTFTPILSHLNESLNGLSTIRAFNKVQDFENILKSKCEMHNSFSYFSCAGHCWLKSSLDSINNLVLLIITSHLLISKETTSAGEGNKI